MKGLLIIPIVGLLVVAGVATGSIQVDFWWGDPNKPPAAIRDVAAVVEAADSGHADEDARAGKELLNLATTRGGEPGARLVRQHMPALVDRIQMSFPLAMQAVEDVDLDTEVGVECRRAVLRSIAQQKYVLGEFGAHLQGTKATWNAVRRFRNEMDSLEASFERDLDDCLVLAKPEERPAIAKLMRSF
jgi:hypothetical protein